jgi:hypothetical protein
MQGCIENERLILRFLILLDRVNIGQKSPFPILSFYVSKWD